MKHKAKLFIVYFPILLVSLQVLGNSLYYIDRSLYYSSAFYLNTFLGTNMLFAIFLMVFTYLFDFCSISRYAAVTEFTFGLFYLIIQKDNGYNVLFQIIFGSGALIWTFSKYIKRFPFCRASLFATFLWSQITTGSCRKGMDKWEGNIKSMVIKKHHQLK